MSVHVGELHSEVTGDGAPAEAKPSSTESAWAAQARLREQWRAMQRDRARTSAEGYGD